MPSEISESEMDSRHPKKRIRQWFHKMRGRDDLAFAAIWFYMPCLCGDLILHVPFLAATKKGLVASNTISSGTAQHKQFFFFFFFLLTFFFRFHLCSSNYFSSLVFHSLRIPTSSNHLVTSPSQRHPPIQHVDNSLVQRSVQHPVSLHLKYHPPYTIDRKEILASHSSANHC